MRSWSISTAQQPMFENPFCIEDLRVFDEETLQHVLSNAQAGITLETLACALHGRPATVINQLERLMTPVQRCYFAQMQHRPYTNEQIEHACSTILDQLFWELTYWKTPELYEALTRGERLHPGIFQCLEADVRSHTVLDAGAGSGRATIECLRYGARQVYAVEPSPGLLRILRRKVSQWEAEQRVVPLRARFEALPLSDQSVDLALSCSAFTADAEQGGEPGLRELLRVTKSGGKVVLIWPRSEDRSWLEARGFRYVFLPVEREMNVYFPSMREALLCAHRFYAHNQAVIQYLLTTECPQVPFSLIGVEPPHYYCWLQVSH